MPSTAGASSVLSTPLQTLKALLGDDHGASSDVPATYCSARITNQESAAAFGVVCTERRGSHAIRPLDVRRLAPGRLWRWQLVPAHAYDASVGRGAGRE